MEDDKVCSIGFVNFFLPLSGAKSSIHKGVKRTQAVSSSQVVAHRRLGAHIPQLSSNQG
jgi:hypothetical protein